MDGKVTPGADRQPEYTNAGFPETHIPKPVAEVQPDEPTPSVAVAAPDPEPEHQLTPPSTITEEGKTE